VAKYFDHKNSDIPKNNWVDRIAPIAARPYLRLARIDRPIGTWLLLLPGWWALSIAPKAGGLPDPFLFLLFGAGAILMRAAGCIINDLFDRKFDSSVARTANRPLASGDISISHACIFLVVLFTLSLLILVQFNRLSVIIGFLSLVLIIPYPLMKRITYWPQAWLGLTFNWGAILGWTAINNEITISTLLLYSAGFFWTLSYDTIYAHQDKIDDLIIGIKSTARLFGNKSRFYVGLFFFISLLLLLLCGFFSNLSWPYYIGLLLAALQAAWQTFTINFDDPKSCLLYFKSNRDFGLIILIAIIFGQIM
tara:strand:+ start:1827 stop:2750 length:924 start_codon:yes stop_codon:yes gene_type:complete